MSEPFLAGVRVVDLTDATGWLCGRILADLGADVVLAEPPGGHPDRKQRYAHAMLNAGKRGVVVDDPSELIRNADVAIASRGPSEELPPALVWCAITPFGLTGPKASRRASDLGVLAQSGTMFMTGEPDRAPLRCTLPTSWYHGGAEAAAGILAALHQRTATGRGQLVDVSLQETHLMATMGRAGAVGLGGTRGSRAGALMRVGKTTQREIWECRDGFVSFGLRGGPARIPGLKRLVAWMVEENMATPALTERDWDSYTHTTLTQDEVDALSAPIAAFFETKTMTELYDAALERGLMLAPANTAREILASRQYNFRDLFVELEDPQLGRITVPRRFVVSEGAPGASRPLTEERTAAFAPRTVVPSDEADGETQAFAGLNVLEFGAGAAGPLSMRYFADHGATVVRIESRKRPDFLRLYAITAEQKSLDGSPMFATFNANKLGVTLNMKHPDALGVALRLVEWADVVAENFAPGAMARWGLSYEEIRKVNPSIVMVSTCLHGQTGPEKDYPGFGGQGSALSGFNHLTGWPDREPLGPYGTITDSLAPRFAAAATMAALLRRRRTGEGAYLDLSQVECAVYSLGETIARQSHTEEPPGRLGNRRPGGPAPHGAFRCAGDDRWIAIAAWDDDEWRTLAAEAGIVDERFATGAGRIENIDELEQQLESWTGSQDRDALAERLQGLGLEAWPVQDLEDCFNDPQLAHRGHFVPMEHPALGTHSHETLGFRLSDSPPRFTRPGPTLGRDNEHVYKDILKMTHEDWERLKADGVFD